MNKIDLAAGGLALCYLVHDGEELLTYRESSRWALGRLPERVTLPAGLREHGWSQRHVNIGIGLMGLNWVGAALAGLRSGGRSAWFQNALATWTLHGFGHLGLCLLRRGYVSGAVTAPLVIGHGVWALRVLREEGVPRRVSAAGMAATLPVLVAGVTTITGSISQFFIILSRRFFIGLTQLPSQICMLTSTPTVHPI